MRSFTGSVTLTDVRIATHNGYFMRQTPFSLLALSDFLGAPEDTEGTGIVSGRKGGEINVYV